MVFNVLIYEAIFIENLGLPVLLYDLSLISNTIVIYKLLNETFRNIYFKNQELFPSHNKK